MGEYATLQWKSAYTYLDQLAVGKEKCVALQWQWNGLERIGNCVHYYSLSNIFIIIFKWKYRNRVVLPFDGDNVDLFSIQD